MSGQKQHMIRVWNRCPSASLNHRQQTRAAIDLHWLIVLSGSHRDSFRHPMALSFILSISFYLLPIIYLHFNHFSVCIWTHLADTWYPLTLVSRVQLIHSTCWKLRYKLRRSAYLTALKVPLYRQYAHTDTHIHTHCKGHGNQLAFSPALN